MKIGIYGLTFKGEIFYIGQSVRIEKRVQEHLNWRRNIREIEKKRKERGRLTAAEALQYQRYMFIGQHENDIDYVILEECDEFNLDANEEYWINKYKPQFNYEGVYDEYRGQHRRELCQTEACAW